MSERISTGIDGLNEILHGGLIPKRTYMVRGESGTGKTILGMHFLTDGTENGERSLYINLEETEADIRVNAEAVGRNVDDVHFLDLSPDSEVFVDGGPYEIFAPGEVERESITGTIIDHIEKLNPDRIFMDPITQLRYLMPDEYQFHKQVLAFMRFLTEQGGTVLFSSQDTQRTSDDHLQFLSDGIFTLGRGSQGRFVTVPKLRGSQVSAGNHSMRIDADGMHVFPILEPGKHERQFESDVISSGVPELDELLHGGLTRGTVTIFTGSTGVGKTTLGVQFMKEAAGRGERSVIYSFEEMAETIVERCSAINIPVEDMLDRGTLSIREIEALDKSASEFAMDVRTDVRENGTKIVMIDGVGGYRLSLRGEEGEFVQKLHALCRYLRNVGVTTILVNEIESVTGDFSATEQGLSYLADNIIFLRHVEFQSEIRTTIGVLKMRTNSFERTLREFEISEYGLKIGEPLTGLQGILTGSPEWVSVDGGGG